MRLEGLRIDGEKLPGAMPVYGAVVDAAQWSDTALGIAQRNGRLVALWGRDARGEGRGFSIQAALPTQHGLLVLSHPLSDTSYPDLARIFPCAHRLPRAAPALLGVSAI